MLQVWEAINHLFIGDQADRMLMQHIWLAHVIRFGDGALNKLSNP
jgi:hypothetical protein